MRQYSPLLLILLILSPLTNTSKKFTFGELGLDLKIINSGSIKKYAFFSAIESGARVEVNCTIFYNLTESNKSSINATIGFNNISLPIELIQKPVKIVFEEHIWSKNVIWIDISVHGANLTIFKNSTIEIKIVDQGGEWLKNFFRILFIVGIITPITILILLKTLGRKFFERVDEWEL